MSGEDIVLEFVLRSQRYLGLTCEQMADIAGVKPDAVKKWRMGINTPGTEAILRIVNALLERKFG